MQQTVLCSLMVCFDRFRELKVEWNFIRLDSIKLETYFWSIIPRSAALLALLPKTQKTERWKAMCFPTIDITPRFGFVGDVMYPV